MTVLVALWGHRGTAEPESQGRIQAGLSVADRAKQGWCRWASPQWHPLADPEPYGRLQGPL